MCKTLPVAYFNMPTQDPTLLHSPPRTRRFKRWEQNHRKIPCGHSLTKGPLKSGHAELLFKHSQIECQSLNHGHTARTVPGLMHQSDRSPTCWGANARTSSRSLMQLAKSYPNKHTRTYDGHLGAFHNLHLKGSWISDANRTLVFF